MKFSYDDFGAWNLFPNSNCGAPHQSPIDFGVTELYDRAADLKFSQYPDKVEVDAQIRVIPAARNAADIQVLSEAQNTIEHEGIVYRHAAIRMHFPSEHTLVTGVHADAELQFVHKGFEGVYSIVSFLVNFDDEGIVTEFFDAADIPTECADESPFNEVNSSNFEICPSNSPNASESMPVTIEGLYDMFGLKVSDLENSKFYHYEGSLTTPNCSGGVNWFIYDQVVTVKTDLEHQDFQKAFLRPSGDTTPYGNNRPVQSSETYQETFVSEVNTETEFTKPAVTEPLTLVTAIRETEPYKILPYEIDPPELQIEEPLIELFPYEIDPPELQIEEPLIELFPYEIDPPELQIEEPLIELYGDSTPVLKVDEPLPLDPLDIQVEEPDIYPIEIQIDEPQVDPIEIQIDEPQVDPIVFIPEPQPENPDVPSYIYEAQPISAELPEEGCRQPRCRGGGVRQNLRGCERGCKGACGCGKNVDGTRRMINHDMKRGCYL